ncbi:MAG: DUF2716 domain-containing protein [Clostridia bacterium]|nr:DUF2716 domain-containing protein [Clostridia bacterium]
MRVVPFSDEYDRIWSQIYDAFDFHPSVDAFTIPFRISQPHVVYNLPELVWDLECESLVEEMLQAAGDEEIYALDWRHPAYVYRPGERHDWGSEGEAFFPSYYPDGNYCFFVAKDLSYGILGHPWHKDLYVFGEKLMALFELHRERLGFVHAAHE